MLLPCGRIVPVVATFIEIVSDPVLPAFTSLEKRAAISLSFLYTTRMMGLFLLLPVLSVLARDLEGATPLLIGLAVGIYALFQAVLQIPFGFMSDRFGRKPVILTGLGIFIAGSLIAAMADSIWGIVIGRALQGGGAISAVIMAMAADLTRDNQRTKIMAVIGASIGLSFIISIILGPLLMVRFNLAGIFYFIAASGVVAVLLVMFVVPDPDKPSSDRNVSVVVKEIPALLRSAELLRIDFGIFVLHLLITAGFVCIPLRLLENGVALESHWSVYLFGAIGSLVVLLPMIGFAERKLPVRWVMVAGIAGLSVALFAMGLDARGFQVAVMWMAVFLGFMSVLESLLPSLASRTAPASLRGTAMGVYSTSQFFGAFVGGLAGGWLVGELGNSNTLMVLGVISLCWLPVAWCMKSPQRLSNYRLSLKESLLNPGQDTGPSDARALCAQLELIPGVVEVSVMGAEKAAYLKVNRQEFDEQSLREFRL